MLIDTCSFNVRSVLSAQGIRPRTMNSCTNILNLSWSLKDKHDPWDGCLFVSLFMLELIGLFWLSLGILLSTIWPEVTDDVSSISSNCGEDDTVGMVGEFSVSGEARGWSITAELCGWILVSANKDVKTKNWQ